MAISSKKAAKIAVVILFAAAISSCGYHFSGTGGLVPEEAKTLSIPVFFNATSEPYIDVEVTQAVVHEFMIDGRLKVVGPEEADLSLRGRITGYEVSPLSYNAYSGQMYVQQYRVHMAVEAVIEDVRSKKIIWREPGIESNFISDFPVTIGDIRATRVSKDAAIKKASQDIAWTLRSRVLEGF